MWCEGATFAPNKCRPRFYLAVLLLVLLSPPVWILAAMYFREGIIGGLGMMPALILLPIIGAILAFGLGVWAFIALIKVHKKSVNQRVDGS